MAVIVWGEPIPVDGKRPAWLREEEQILMFDGGNGGDLGDGWHGHRMPFSGRDIGRNERAIRLPNYHFYYLAKSRGFEYWPGGESAPEDWDYASDVLLSTGDIMPCTHRTAIGWQCGRSRADIIGYKRAVVESVVDVPQWAVDRANKLRETDPRAFARYISAHEKAPETDADRLGRMMWRAFKGTDATWNEYAKNIDGIAKSYSDAAAILLAQGVLIP